jgi:tetratricopeptide (TPR) repeat protein/ribosomal protein S8
MSYNHFIIFDGCYDRLTIEGVVSCLYVIGSILQRFRQKAYSEKQISDKLLEEGFSFAGFSCDSEAHNKVIDAFLKDLANFGFLKFEDSIYRIVSPETSVKLCCEIVRVLIEEGYIKEKETLEGVAEVIKVGFGIDNFSIGLLVKESKPETQQKITKIMGTSTHHEQDIVPIIRKKAVEALECDQLASAAYWQLEAELHFENGEEKQAKQCTARSSISLAIFSKRQGNHKDAAKYYEKAADIMAKYPEYSKNATLQRANALSSKARYLTQEGNFQESSTYYLKAAELFDKLGNAKEATYCKFMNLKSEAREQASYNEYVSAAKLLRDAGNLIKPYAVNHYFDCLAHAALYEKNYAYSLGDFEEAAKASKEAASFFNKAKNEKLYFRALGTCAQLEGLDLERKRAPFGKIAEKFKVAAEHYDKALDFEASSVAFADSMKNFGLEAKKQGNFQGAIDCFSEGKRVLRELQYSSDKQEVIRNCQNGETWFEAMIVETKANHRLVEEIQQKKKLDDVARMLAHSADLFTQVGDYKHANINSTFIIVTMAIDAFHEEDYAKANELVREAKSRLPQDFASLIFEGEVKPGWEPLRYSLDALANFDKYARQIETEKGFSYESRIRDLLRKMFPEFAKIESIVFKPEEHEIGIVFDDNTPIEIDAFGTNVRGETMNILIAEIKNVSKPIGAREVNKFLKKMDFVAKRYSTIARLSSLKKAVVTNKLFLSSSGFQTPAMNLAEKNNIQIFNKEKIKTLLKRHSQYSLP